MSFARVISIIIGATFVTLGAVVVLDRVLEGERNMTIDERMKSIQTDEFREQTKDVPAVFIAKVLLAALQSDAELGMHQGKVVSNEVGVVK